MFLPSLDGGGAEGVFVQLANEFTRLGCAVDLVLVTARGTYLREVAAEVRLVDLCCSRVTFSLPKLIGYLRSERPDVLLSGLDTSNIVAVLATALSFSKNRTVISQRAVKAPLRLARESASSLIIHLVTRILIRLTYPWSDHVIAVSTDVANELNLIPFLRKGKVSTVFNPIPLSYIETQVSRQDNDCIRLSPYILGVGRLEKQKDFATLIRAFSIIAPKTKASLVILGEGTERAALSNLVSGLGLQNRISLPGFMENPFPWFANASVFVLSSAFEGCPNALMQALACGAPVISTDCPGGSAIILEQGKWGRLVPTGEPEAMAAAILATLDSPTRPDVRQRVNDFALNRIAREYLHILLPDYLPSALEH